MPKSTSLGTVLDTGTGGGLQSMQWEPGKQYLISYINESLETSVRTIDVIGTSRARDGRVYIRALCHLRGSERTFRADRVTQSELVQQAYHARASAPIPPLPKMAESFDTSLHHHAESPIAADPGFHEIQASGGSGSSPLRWAICIIFLTFLFIASLANLQGSGPSWSSASTTIAHSAVSTKPAPRPSPPPKPALEETTIAGYTLRTVRGGGQEHYEVPKLGLVTKSKLEAIAAIRLPNFVKSEGFFDADLVSRYLDADLNGSGKLSFDELRVFQQKTYREFRYQANDLALRPDEFLAAGGGDCEDFALYTASLLRFWGWKPFIGSFAASKGSTGHAVCLSYEEGAFPKDYEYFKIDDWTTVDGSPLPAGKYVPIDYDHVGSLSNAVGSGWKLRSVFIPEKIWGLSM